MLQIRTAGVAHLFPEWLVHITPERVVHIRPECPAHYSPEWAAYFTPVQPAHFTPVYSSAWYRTAPSIYQAERRQGPLIHHLLSDSSTSGFYTTVARGFHRMVSHGGGASYGFCGRGGTKGKYNRYLPLLATSSPRIRPRLMPYTVRPIYQQTQS